MNALRPVARLAAVACLFAAATTLAEEPPVGHMQAEIDRLLVEVEASNCVFIRNGREHSAGDAADHLRMKRRRGKRYYDSTESFIERLASRSSWSGKNYRIRCNDETVTAAEWFAERLQRIRSGRDAEAP